MPSSASPEGECYVPDYEQLPSIHPSHHVCFRRSLGPDVAAVHPVVPGCVYSCLTDGWTELYWSTPW